MKVYFIIYVTLDIINVNIIVLFYKLVRIFDLGQLKSITFQYGGQVILGRKSRGDRSVSTFNIPDMIGCAACENDRQIYWALAVSKNVFKNESANVQSIKSATSQMIFNQFEYAYVSYFAFQQHISNLAYSIC